MMFDSKRLPMPNSMGLDYHHGCFFMALGYEVSLSFLFRGAWGFPGGASGKEPPANAEDIRDGVSIPELGRSPGEGNGYPLQYSSLGEPMDRGSWQATVHDWATNTYTHATWLDQNKTKWWSIYVNKILLLSNNFKQSLYHNTLEYSLRQTMQSVK